MLNAKGVSVVLAIALCGSSFAAEVEEFKFPTKKLVKTEGTCDFFCQYGFQMSNAVIGTVTFGLGYLLAYQIHAVRARVLDNGIADGGAGVLAAVDTVVDVVEGSGGKAKRGRGRSKSARRKSHN